MQAREIQITRSSDKTNTRNKNHLKARLVGRTEWTANGGMVEECEAWRRQIQRERDDLGRYGCQMALTREAKRDNEGLRLMDKSLSPKSHHIRGICFVVHNHGRSGRHMGTHSGPMTLVPFLFGLTLRWKILESGHKLSEVDTISKLTVPKGRALCFNVKTYGIFPPRVPFGFKSQLLGFVPSPHWIHCGGFQVWALSLHWPQLSHFGWRWS